MSQEPQLATLVSKYYPSVTNTWNIKEKKILILCSALLVNKEQINPTNIPEIELDAIYKHIKELTSGGIEVEKSKAVPQSQGLIVSNSRIDFISPDLDNKLLVFIKAYLGLKNINHKNEVKQILSTYIESNLVMESEVDEIKYIFNYYKELDDILMAGNTRQIIRVVRDLVDRKLGISDYIGLLKRIAQLD